MSWALRFVVLEVGMSLQQYWPLHVGYQAKQRRVRSSSFKKHVEMRCRCKMTNVLRTCRSEKWSLLSNSFGTTVRKAMSDSWKNAPSVKIYRVEVCKIQKIQLIRKTIHQTTTKMKSEFQSHTSMWTMGEIEVRNFIWLVGQIRDVMIFSESLWVFTIHRKSEICTRWWYHIFPLGYLPNVIKTHRNIISIS